MGFIPWALTARAAVSCVTRRPWCASFELTHNCNARCHHCHRGAPVAEHLATPARLLEVCRELHPSRRVAREPPSVGVFKFYAVQLGIKDSCGECGDNVLESFVRAAAFEKLERWGSRAIPFGVIFSGADGLDEAAYAADVLAWVDLVRGAIGRPEQVVFQIWAASADGRGFSRLDSAAR